MDKKMNWVNEEMWEDYTKRVSIEIGSMEFHRTMFGRMLKAVECRNTDFLYGDMLVFNPEYPGELDFETSIAIVNFVEKHKLSAMVQSYIKKVCIRNERKKDRILKALTEYYGSNDLKNRAIAAIAIEYGGIPFGVIHPMITLDEVKEVFKKVDISKLLEDEK